MTYLKILMYARAGIQAKIDEYRGMQEKALEGAWAHAGAKALEPFPKKRTRKCRKKRNESMSFCEMLVHAA